MDKTKRIKDAKGKNHVLLIACFLLCIVLTLAYLMLEIARHQYGFEEAGTDRNYHVLVVGQAESQLFLNQVFEGAKSLSEKYNAVVELKVPNSLAENISLQSLIDYSSFVNADGIIAFVHSQSAPFHAALRSDGTDIPVISIGYYLPENPQVSFIGSNYSALGRRIGAESESLFNSRGKAYVVISGISSSPNHSNLLNSLLGYYRARSISNFEVFDKSLKENEESVLQMLCGASLENSALICLTEKDSMTALQLATAQNAGGKIKILGFGENEALGMYLKKGILSRLISFDPKKIGRTAMTELFEYRNKGYANSYITAELQVRKAENECDAAH